MREKSRIEESDKKGSPLRSAPSPEKDDHDDKDDFRNTMHTTTGAFGEEKLVQFVVFSLGDEEFGVDIEQVSEIVRIGKFAPIPDSPKFIRGLTNVRGTIIAVIDLKKRFTLREEKNVEGKHIIITREQKNLLGILVDEVTEVLRVAQKEIKPTPGMTTVIHKKYMRGVITVGDRMIIILDLKSVLSEDELEKLAQLRDTTLEKKDHSFKRKLIAETEKEKEEKEEQEERRAEEESEKQELNNKRQEETTIKKKRKGHEKNTSR
jgi:purine-binding chemotaxis protein CheW